MTPDTSSDLLEKDDTVDTATHDAVDTERHETNGTVKEPPAAEKAGDPIESPLQLASQAGEWTDSEDPEDPLNWSTTKKAYHAAIPSIYCFTV